MSMTQQGLDVFGPVSADRSNTNNTNTPEQEVSAGVAIGYKRSGLSNDIEENRT